MKYLGASNFRNEIIWKTISIAQRSQNAFGNVHDTIYSSIQKVETYIFNTAVSTDDAEEYR